MPTPGRVIGGQRATAFIFNARRAQATGVRSVAVGFFETARYSNTHLGIRGGSQRQALPVAAVAAWNEYGTENSDGSTAIPERPFMRRSNETLDDVLLPILLANVSPTDMTLDRRTAGLLGVATQGHIQRTITEGDFETNAESTVARKHKAGADATPLIDTGHMRRTISYRVDEPGAEV